MFNHLSEGKVGRLEIDGDKTESTNAIGLGRLNIARNHINCSAFKRY